MKRKIPTTEETGEGKKKKKKHMGFSNVMPWVLTSSSDRRCDSSKPILVVEATFDCLLKVTLEAEDMNKGALALYNHVGFLRAMLMVLNKSGSYCHVDHDPPRSICKKITT